MSQRQRLCNEKTWCTITFWNTLGFDLDYNSCGMTFLLARCIPSVKWGLLMCFVGIVLDVGPSQVLFWFCLFPPLPSPFRQKVTGVLPFWTAVQTQLAGAWEEWAVGRQRSYRQSAGSPNRSSAPSARTVWNWPGGEEGGQEAEEDRGLSVGRTGACRQFRLQYYNIWNVITSFVFNTSEHITKPRFLSFFPPPYFCPWVFLRLQTTGRVLTVVQLLSAHVPPSLSQQPSQGPPQHMQSNSTNSHTCNHFSLSLPFPPRAHVFTSTTLLCAHPSFPRRKFVLSSCRSDCSGDNMQPPPPHLPSLTKDPRAEIQTMCRAAAELWCSPVLLATTWG